MVGKIDGRHAVFVQTHYELDHPLSQEFIASRERVHFPGMFMDGARLISQLARVRTTEKREV